MRNNQYLILAYAALAAAAPAPVPNPVPAPAPAPVARQLGGFSIPGLSLPTGGFGGLGSGSGSGGGLSLPTGLSGSSGSSSGSSGLSGLGGLLGGLGLNADAAVPSLSIPTEGASIPSLSLPTGGLGGLGGSGGGLSLPTGGFGGLGGGSGGGGLSIPTGLSGSSGSSSGGDLSGLGGLGLNAGEAVPTLTGLPTATAAPPFTGFPSGLPVPSGLPAPTGVAQSSGWKTEAKMRRRRQLSDLSSLLSGSTDSSESSDSSDSSSSTDSLTNLLASSGSAVQNGLENACQPVTVIFARGTTEASNMGTVVGPGLSSDVASALSNKVNVQGVDYAADAAGIASEALGGSTGAGTQAMLADVSSALSKCPDTQLILSGYSQGAMLVHNTLGALNSSAAGNVKAAVTFGDPFVGTMPKNLAEGAFKSFCASGDPVCSTGASSSPSSGGTTSKSTLNHLGYGSDAGTAATFIKGKVTV